MKYKIEDDVFVESDCFAGNKEFFLNVKHRCGTSRSIKPSVVIPKYRSQPRRCLHTFEVITFTFI